MNGGPETTEEEIKAILELITKILKNRPNIRIQLKIGLIFYSMFYTIHKPDEVSTINWYITNINDFLTNLNNNRFSIQLFKV